MSRFPRESVVMTKHSDWLERGGRRVCHVFCRREEGPAKNSKRGRRPPSLLFDGLGTTTEAHEALGSHTIFTLIKQTHGQRKSLSVV